jgi:hypothetical protein
MTIEESLQQVLARWKRAFTQYDELRQMSTSAVVRWEWTEFERYILLPFYFQRHPGRGRVITAPTDRMSYYYHYGFDGSNRPRIHLFYNYLDLPEAEFIKQADLGSMHRNDLGQAFYTYSDNLAEVVEYSLPPRIPLKLQQIFSENKRVIRHASLRLNGYTPLYSEKGRDPDQLYEWLGYNGRFRLVEEYVYDGHRLTSILRYNESPGLTPYKAEEHFFYDDAGKLVRIEQVDEHGGRQLLYKQRGKGQNFKSIRQAAIQKLIPAIANRLREEHISEKLCYIELFYQSGSSHFPPTIFLGREKDRQELLTSDNKENRYFIFAPGMTGKPWSLDLTDPDVLDICSQLEQEIQSSQKWDAATSILRQVAAGLTRYDWRDIIEVTPDFVVFAIDWEVEGDHLAEVLASSVSQAQLSEWRARGWL